MAKSSEKDPAKEPSFDELEAAKKAEVEKVEPPKAALPKVEEPKVEPPKAPRLICVEMFGQFGKTFFPGDVVVPDEKWPDGTLQRRLDGGFVKFEGL